MDFLLRFSLRAAHVGVAIGLAGLVLATIPFFEGITVIEWAAGVLVVLGFVTTAVFSAVRFVATIAHTWRRLRRMP